VVTKEQQLIVILPGFVGRIDRISTFRFKLRDDAVKTLIFAALSGHDGLGMPKRKSTWRVWVPGQDPELI
jgi:hypothetical protein